MAKMSSNTRFWIRGQLKVGGYKFDKLTNECHKKGTVKWVIFEGFYFRIFQRDLLQKLIPGCTFPLKIYHHN